MILLPLVFAPHALVPQHVDALSYYRGARAFGSAVAGAGDVDADGVPDVIVGEPNWIPGHPAGRVLVYSGASGELLHEIRGSRMGAAIGRAVSSAGDVNGDGRADFAFSSYPDRSRSVQEPPGR